MPVFWLVLLICGTGIDKTFSLKFFWSLLGTLSFHCPGPVTGIVDVCAAEAVHVDTEHNNNYYYNCDPLYINQPFTTIWQSWVFSIGLLLPVDRLAVAALYGFISRTLSQYWRCLNSSKTTISAKQRSTGLKHFPHLDKPHPFRHKEPTTLYPWLGTYICLKNTESKAATGRITHPTGFAASGSLH